METREALVERPHIGNILAFVIVAILVPFAVGISHLLDHFDFGEYIASIIK